MVISLSYHREIMVFLILSCLDKSHSKILRQLIFFSFFLEKLNLDDSAYGKVKFLCLKFANSKKFLCF